MNCVLMVTDYALEINADNFYADDLAVRPTVIIMPLKMKFKTNE